MIDFFVQLSNGREVRVTGNATSGSRGARDSLGAPEEPDEPPSFELVDVHDAGGRKVILDSLSANDMNLIQQTGEEEMEECKYN